MPESERGVVLGPDVQTGIEGLGDQFADGRNEVQLGVGGVFVEKLLCAGRAGLDEDVRSGQDGFFVDRQGQFFGQRVGAQLDLVAGLERQGIMDEDFGEFGTRGSGMGGVLSFIRM